VTATDPSAVATGSLNSTESGNINTGSGGLSGNGNMGGGGGGSGAGGNGNNPTGLLGGNPSSGNGNGGMNLGLILGVSFAVIVVCIGAFMLTLFRKRKASESLKKEAKKASSASNLEANDSSSHSDNNNNSHITLNVDSQHPSSNGNPNDPDAVNVVPPPNYENAISNDPPSYIDTLVNPPISITTTTGEAGGGGGAIVGAASSAGEVVLPAALNPDSDARNVSVLDRTVMASSQDTSSQRLEDGGVHHEHGNNRSGGGSYAAGVTVSSRFEVFEGSSWFRGGSEKSKGENSKNPEGKSQLQQKSQLNTPMPSSSDALSAVYQNHTADARPSTPPAAQTTLSLSSETVVVSDTPPSSTSLLPPLSSSTSYISEKKVDPLKYPSSDPWMDIDDDRIVAVVDIFPSLDCKVPTASTTLSSSSSPITVAPYIAVTNTNGIPSSDSLSTPQITIITTTHTTTTTTTTTTTNNNNNNNNNIPVLPKPIRNLHPTQWKKQHVQIWLKSLGCSRATMDIFEHHSVNGPALMGLTNRRMKVDLEMKGDGHPGDIEGEGEGDGDGDMRREREKVERGLRLLRIRWNVLEPRDGGRDGGNDGGVGLGVGSGGGLVGEGVEGLNGGEDEEVLPPGYEGMDSGI
jgi:hypothetical protein